jgi:formylglycine-generating enzyme required for sulfatase activity
MGSRGPEAGPNADPSHKPNETRHQVTLTKGFWIATAECAQAQWKAVMDSAPSVFPRSGEEDVHPVDSVSWNDAMAFAAAVNARHPGLGMTLPTEAQWEYACRAETTTAFYSGPNDIRGDANSKHLDVIGWYAGNSAAWKGSGKTPETAPANAADLSAEFSDFLFGPPEFTRFAPHRVGNHAKNDWGLKDFSGNLAEWFADVYAEDLGASDATDPFTDAGGALRVVRGGSWRSAAADCRSCARSGLAPDTARDDLGFRPIIPGDATP